MNCRDVRLLLTRYVDGETDGYEQTLIEDHLRVCKACTVEVSQLKMTRQRVQREIKRWAASAVPPPRAWDRLIAKLTAEKETPAQASVRPNNPTNNPLRRGLLVSRRIALAGLLMLVIAAVLVLVLRHLQ